MEKVIVLNSGGLDSALVALYLKDNFDYELHSLYLDLKLINNPQTEAAAAITAQKWCSSNHIIRLDMGVGITNSWETRGDLTSEIEMWDSLTEEQRENYRLNRSWLDFRSFPNITMVANSIAVAYAKTQNIMKVYTGHRISIGGEGYLERYNDMAEENRLKLVRPKIYIPFADAATYKEAAIRAFGQESFTLEEKQLLRSNFAHTYSCRWPTPCGVCEKCTGRAEVGLV